MAFDKEKAKAHEGPPDDECSIEVVVTITRGRPRHLLCDVESMNAWNTTSDDRRERNSS